MKTYADRRNTTASSSNKNLNKKGSDHLSAASGKFGNPAMHPSAIQTKLAMGEPGNNYEKGDENRISMMRGPALDRVDELEGLAKYYTADGSYIGSIGTSTEIRVVTDKNLKEATKYIGWANYDESVGVKRINELNWNTDKANSLSTSLIDYATPVNDVLNDAKLETWYNNGENCYTAACNQMSNAGQSTENKYKAIQTDVDNSKQSKKSKLSENKIGGSIYAITQLKKGNPVMVGVKETETDGTVTNVKNYNKNTGHFVVISGIKKVGKSISLTYYDNANETDGKSSDNQFDLDLTTGKLEDTTNIPVGDVDKYEVSEIRRNK